MHFATDVAEANAYVPTKKGELTQAYVSLRNPLRLAPKRVIIGGEEKNLYTPVTKGQYENLPSDFKKKYDKQYKSGFGEGEGDLGYGYTEWFESVLQSMKPARAKEVVQEMGYDGIIYTAKANYDNRRYRPFDAFIAFSPTQIKSINNRGTFDPNNPNILKQSFAGMSQRAGELAAALNETGTVKAEEGSISPTGILYSTRTWTQAEKAQIKDLAKEMGIDESKVDKWMYDIDNAMARVLADPSLDFIAEAADLYSALKPNSDPHYTVSLDFSTLCRKRYELMATIEAIQNMTGCALTKESWVEVREMLDKMGYNVSCGACYVDSKRMEAGKFINKFIDSHPDEDPKQFLSQAGIDQFKRDNPSLYAEFKKAIGSNNAKTPESRTDYHGEIRWYFLEGREQDMKATQETDKATWSSKRNSARGKKRVEAMNKKSGLRWQSWSDFEVPHLMDAMQAVLDMHMAGLMGHAYTKVPDFVLAMGKTGLMVNMSLIPKGTGLDTNGALVFDTKEGMPFDVVS